MHDALEKAALHGLIRQLDLHFARFMCELAENDSPELLLAACLVSWQTGEGSVCIDLPDFAGMSLFPSETDGMDVAINTPPLEMWRSTLMASSVVGEPGQNMPLILDPSDRLYLGRYWRFESNLAINLRARAAIRMDGPDKNRLRAGLQRLFPSKDRVPDWQKIAAAIAVLKNFTVISGGPGTGKTWTVANILILLTEQALPASIRIAMAAPTGKAAARLTESIKTAKQTLVCADSIKEAIPEKASTIHHLLHAVPGKPGFRHNARNSLHLDLLVIDEASMVDLPLMARLMDALPPHARLILLGDKDQLSSMGAGSVLGDICGNEANPAYSERLCTDLEEVTDTRIGPPEKPIRSQMSDNIVFLRKSYRFSNDSGIGTLARTINKAKEQSVLDILNNGDFPDLSFRSLEASQLPACISETVEANYVSNFKKNDPIKVLEEFNHFRILCALKEGPFGAKQINQYVEQALRRKGLIHTKERWYAGCPIMITRNDYRLKLFNGDIGVLLPDGDADNKIRAFFIMPDGTLRKFLPNRLPEHETVYAVTVHKSQGSEFDRVLMVLPNQDSPVLTRELVYTGITRARDYVEIWATQSVFLSALSRRMQRSSGLRDLLWDFSTGHFS